MELWVAMWLSSGQWAISYVLVVDTTFRRYPSEGDTSVFPSSCWQECRHDSWSWSNHLESWCDIGPCMEDVCWEMKNNKVKELWMPMIVETSLTLDFYVYIHKKKISTLYKHCRFGYSVACNWTCIITDTGDNWCTRLDWEPELSTGWQQWL